jgi:hypothetical protein
MPVPMRRDFGLSCTRCGADASFGYTKAQNPKIRDGVRLCMNCYQRAKVAETKKAPLGERGR